MRGAITILTGLLLVAALVLWVGAIATLGTLTASDPAGNALSEAYGTLLLLACWGLVAVLLVVAGARGELAGWVRLAAVVLVPLTGAVSVGILQLLKDPGVPRWAIVVPALGGALLLAYTALALFPSLRSRAAGLPVDTVVWGALLVLGLAPWPFLAQARRAAATRRMELADASAHAGAAAQAALDAENERRLAALGDSAPALDLLAFTQGGNPLREETLARLRRRPALAAELEALVAAGNDVAVLELHQLAPPVTPSLCAAVTEYLARDAAAYRPGTPGPVSYGQVAWRVERHLPALGFLHAQGCRLDAALAAYEAAVATFPPSAEGDRFRARLAALRSPADR